MNKKIDDVLYNLLETKQFIVKTSMNDKSNISYDNTIKNLDNLIVDYTMNNKMSHKEILDTTFSLYNLEVKKGFTEKVKDVFNIPKHIKNIKNKIIENHKKKEIKQQYENEIVDLVKEKLKAMIDEDKKTTQKEKDVDKEKSIDNKKTLDKNIVNKKELHVKNDKVNISIVDNTYKKNNGIIVENEKSIKF